MISERHEELAALYALGLLEGPERDAFEAELRGNAELADFTRALTETASSIALTPPPAMPPPALKQRILDALPPSPPEAVSTSAIHWGTVVPWGLAASLVFGLIWLGRENMELRTQNEALATDRRLTEIALRSAKNELTERSLVAETMINNLGRQLRRSEDLARLKVSALASLAGNTKEAQAIAVWDPDAQAGLLTFDKMPVIADNQDYQIWVVDPAYPNPVNGGVFTVDKDGRASLAFKPDQPVRQAAAFAISLEKKGGVPKAEGPIVLLGKVPGI